ncbi:RNA-binding, RBD [Venustampulla echinocandica]|uniref:RNA-binding, RBD n=1 Tax=Venustampulla echinocandica TaxID=2656787 RepID=A0A370T936_9HELO|nr:RNA-binding, RBD [Venustampulla echinocandica]RDL29991.1 RNA-binding, RBD [Venustampulla echinocandica]
MSYPPPPGLNNSSSHSPHPSLPARPPPSSIPPRPTPPAYNAATSRAPSSSSSSSSYPAATPAFAGFAPRRVQVAAPPQSYNSYQAQPPYQPPQPAYGGYAAPQQDYGAAPQIRNPFAPPSAAGGARSYDDDPDMAAQIAQWQSAYAARDTTTPTGTSGYTGPVRRYPNTGEGAGAATSANAAPLGAGPPEKTGPSMSSAAMSSAAHVDSDVANIVSDSKDPSQKTVVRSGGGSTWTDSSLLEWDPAHFRLFVGNLAGEVTDESLYKAFSRWPSIQKARVIRDKRTTKSKGYGFVSFSDGEEFFAAAREMQGKYIGSHPVLLRRSTTEIKAVRPKDAKHGKHGKNQKGGGNKGKGGESDRDRTGAGVHKAGSKTKGGLKVLG